MGQFSLEKHLNGLWILCCISVVDHFYLIGDCGGATVEARCGECNARIGGAAHRLRDDNRFAPEVDGAAASAWPGMDANR